MRQASAWFSCPAVAIGCLVALWGCGGDQQLRTEAVGGLARLLAVASDSALELRSAVVPDTVRPGGRLDLLYLLLNGGPSREFVHNPDWFSFRIINESGDTVPPLAASAITRTWGERVRIVLPSEAVVGRLVNLSCVDPGYGTVDEPECEYSYRLETPGRYRIITTYGWPESGGGRGRLVDTASVIVRSR